MTIDTFWIIVESAHNHSSCDMDAKCDALSERLSSLSPDDIKAFRQHFNDCDARAYDWGLWGAAYIINGGCSDDSFSDFRSSLISRGRRIFESALADPDSLADLGLTADNACYEGYAYAVTKAETAVLGAVCTEATSFPTKPSGKPWDEDKLPLRFPRLWELYAEEEDLDTLICMPSGKEDAFDSFLAFVACYLAMTDTLTTKKKAEYATEIAALKTFEQLPDHFWRSLRTAMKRDWITPKKKASVFEHICDGFSYYSSFVTFQEVFGVSVEETPIVEATWSNYKLFANALSDKINQKANKP